MSSNLNFQVHNHVFRSIRYHNSPGGVSSSRHLMSFRFAQSKCSSLSIKPENSSCEPVVSSDFTTAVGSPSSSLPLSQWILTQRHIMMLNAITCTAAISATWLFCSAIPTLLAFKKAAESMEKLLDVTREELPDTMAAIRLSGMEISDLTMELSDLGQDITQGVKSSTRAVRVAEERLRSLTNMAPSVTLQAVFPPENRTMDPEIARTARGIREGIVKGRSLLQLFFTSTQFAKIALNYIKSKAKP